MKLSFALLLATVGASFQGFKYDSSGRTFLEIKDMIDSQFLGGLESTPTLEIPSAVLIAQQCDYQDVFGPFYHDTREILKDDLDSSLPWDNVSDNQKKLDAAFVMSQA